MMGWTKNGLGLIEYARKLANDAGVQMTDDEVVDMIERSLACDDEAWENARKAHEDFVIKTCAAVVKEAKKR